MERIIISRIILMITSPIKTIKNIKNVSFRQNNLADIGLFEIEKFYYLIKELKY